MSDINPTIPRCGYCGNYYSAEMRKDMMTHSGFVQITSVTKTEQEIRADERARIREGAVDKIAKYLADRRYWTFDTVTERSIPADCLFDAARIVDAVLGKE